MYTEGFCHSLGHGHAPSDVHLSNSSRVSKSSSCTLQIPVFSILNSARSNSRNRFRQWNAKLREVQRFLLIMGSQYHLNAWLTCSFFLLKWDVYKGENLWWSSFQELKGKSLLYYRQVLPSSLLPSLPGWSSSLRRDHFI